MKLMKPGELETAQHAMHGLRIILTAAEKSGVGADAKKMMESVDLHLRSSTNAIEVIAGSADFHAGVRILALEHSQLKQKALTLLAELRTKAGYTGLRRSQMSLQERVAYVRQNGEQKFSILPD